MNLASVVEPHPDGDRALVVPGSVVAGSMVPGSMVPGSMVSGVDQQSSGGTVTTYGELRDEVARLRGGLSELGVEPGDRVALVAPNDGGFVVAYLAILGIGAVAVPLNPHSPAPELQRELEVAGAKVLMVGSPGAGRALGAVERTALPELTRVVSPGTLADAIPGAVTWEGLAASDPGPMVERQPDDLAALVFTSGTAGSPRAAMLTHGNLRANVDQIHANDPDLTPADVFLGVLPLFHIYGLNAALAVALARGSSVVLVDPFDAATTLSAIRHHGVTVIPGVPTMWSAWASVPDAGPQAFAAIRLATSGAAPLDPTVRQTLRDRFGLTVVEGYGLTEASPAVTTGIGVDAPDGSVGVALPDVAVRLVDPVTGDDALVGDPGEIWVKGPNVFPGYWNDPDATAAALSLDGFLRTGDVAVVDDDGFLYLVDRAKDLVIVSGFNVYPAEVEHIIEAHPSVTEAAVVGTPDPQTGEAVTAYVVTHDEVTADDLVAHCHRHLARYKCPAKITFVDELPHSLTGKVQRRKLQGRP